MKMDVIGRARNVQLPLSKPLLPLFEAIMNSVQAINDAKEENGKIDIEVIRDNSSNLLLTDRATADITGFGVKDNGIGFDENNYDAFLTSDTTYKENRGGKGIGRFLWLAAFERVEIDSIFEVNGKKNRRCFKFRLSEKGIEDASCREQLNLTRGTTVNLIGYKSKYSIHCPKRLESIATLIIEQFLDIFISPNRPEILLHDNLTSEVINLDTIYEKEIVGKIERKEVTIKDRVFELVFVRLYSTHISDHKVNLCANDRVVMSEKLSGIPNLIKRFRDGDKEFVYAIYVHSEVLDTAVNQERTNFNLLNNNDGLFEKEITMVDIWQAIREACKDHLKPYTGPIAKSKQDRIEKFVANDGVMYRPILKYLESKIDEINPEAEDNEIDRYLYDGYHDLQVKLRSEGQSLLQESTKVTDENLEQYKQRFHEYFEKITEANSADLARYVCSRKAIIEFLKKQLSLQENGKYSQENQIHDIIFPRGKTSDNILFNEHNLWLIDERLAFHTYLTSDQPIQQAKLLQSQSKKEPDILVFDKAMAFSETTTIPFSSITIIEFKRPLRNEYSEEENPFNQIFEYISDINSGKAKTKEGRPLTVPETLPFYCYIICDLTPKLKQWAKNYGCIQTPDGLGYFMQNTNYKAYCEVISYNKLVADAEKRNKAFFNKIGL
ncbi:MAG: ATP-binding protein [Candidatus Omnitrophota bacterium]